MKFIKNTKSHFFTFKILLNQKLNYRKKLVNFVDFAKEMAMSNAPHATVYFKLKLKFLNFKTGLKVLDYQNLVRAATHYICVCPLCKGSSQQLCPNCLGDGVAFTQDN